MMRHWRYFAFTYYLLALYLTTVTVTGKSPEKNKNDDDEADLYNLKPSTETEDSAQNKVQIKDRRLNDDKDSVMPRAGDDVGKSREDKSLNSLLKSVLITLRDHPEIIWEIIRDEEMTKERYFQRPSPQLQLAPKRVEKKAGSRTYKLLKGKSKNYYKNKYASSSSSDESTENSDNSKSGKANYYKTKYGSDSSETSEHTSEENSKDSEEHSPSSSDESITVPIDKRVPDSEENLPSSSDESITVPIDKRVPEKPEETIDITTLTKPSNDNDVDLTDIPSEGGLEDVPEYKAAEEDDTSENTNNSNDEDEETENIETSDESDAKVRTENRDKETSDESDAKEFGDGE